MLHQQIVGVGTVNIKMRKANSKSPGEARNSFDCHEIFRSGK